MIQFEINVIISKPTEVIAKALAKPENHIFWTTDLILFELIEGKPNQAGAIAKLHYSKNGKEYTMEDRLILCEPGKRYISNITGEAIKAKVETTLEPIGDITKMTIKWSGKPQIFILKLLMPLMRKSIVKKSVHELNTFKKLVEEQGESFV